MRSPVWVPVTVVRLAMLRKALGGVIEDLDDERGSANGARPTTMPAAGHRAG
jgi:predicted oxidoreductase